MAFYCSAEQPVKSAVLSAISERSFLLPHGRLGIKIATSTHWRGTRGDDLRRARSLLQFLVCSPANEIAQSSLAWADGIVYNHSVHAPVNCCVKCPHQERISPLAFPQGDES